MTIKDIILLVVVALLLLLLLLLLFSRRLRRSLGFGRGKGDGAGTGSASGPSPADIEAERRAAEAARAREAQAKTQAAGTVLKDGDDFLIRQLMRRAGLGHRPLRGVSATAEDVLAVAKALSLDELEAFRLAAVQKDVEIDLDRDIERRPADCPTADVSPEMMADIAQMHAVVPEQLMLPDEQFYQALAEQQLTVLQSYESTAKKKRLYLLLDVSSSMGELMPNGRPRHVWARGVAVNLLLKALRGEAEYVCRAFDGDQHELREARDEKEAIALIDHLLERGFSGSGTDIMRALRTAASDIRARGDAFETDILLISDGEAEVQEAALKALLGKDIRLHLMQIGGKANPALRAAATTCREL